MTDQQQQLAPSLEDVARQALDFAGDMMQQLGWARQQGDDLHRELDRDEANAYRLFNACWDALGMGPRPKPGALTERREHGLVTRWCDQCMSVHPADDPSCAVVVSMVPRCPTCGGHGYGPRAAYDGQPCPQCHGTGGKPDMAKSRSCGCLVTDSEYDACCGELCRKDRAAWREERFAPVTKSAPLDAYQDERRLACDLGLCEQHGSRTPREHLVVPNGNTDTEKRAEDTECDRSVTPDHRRGRFGQEVQPRDNGVLTSTGYIAPVNADGLYREDGLEASTKTPCPDCGHFQGAHLTGEGCNRRNCDCPRTYNTPAKDGNE